jgi:hypothetical protein
MAPASAPTDPQQRRDQPQPLAEKIGRAEAGKLLFVLDHEPGVGRQIVARIERLDGLFHFTALAFMQRHELDRFRQREHANDRQDDRHDAADRK